jgi:hypothetical protein
MRTILWICVLMSMNRLAGQVNYYDVLIHEIMADPSPVIGLPNTEYIELKNTSSNPVNLFRWKISNGSTIGTINTSWILQPDSLVVLCSRTQATLFDSSIKVIGITSFPSLLNDGGNILLVSPEGKSIHAISYRADMHDNPVKKEGGWSLEMTDSGQPCHPGNWHSSRDSKGGTPGKANNTSPNKLSEWSISALNCTAENSTSLLLQLNQGTDSISAAITSSLAIRPSDTRILSMVAVAPYFDQIKISLQSPLQPGKIYTLEHNNLRRCKSRQRDSISIRTGIVAEASPGDVLVNEVLFNPPPGGSDFVELFNRSEKIINLKDMLIANKSETGVISSVYPISMNHSNFFPGEHIVLTADSAFLMYTWPASEKNKIIKTQLPSLPDEKGNICILNKQGDEIDALTYNEKMHFALLNNTEGVSLERISSIYPGSEAANWHSAASASNYGTPTLQNSQHKTAATLSGNIKISPEILSPNNDGTDDVLSLHYSFKENGNLLTVNLFNMAGVLLGKIVNNVLCGTSGTLHWNGSINNKQLQNGLYILLIDVLGKTGKSMKTRKILAIQ